MPSESVASASAEQGKLMLDQVKQTNLLDISGVCRSFPKGSGEDLLVLEKVDLTIHSGEIVGLLGVPDRASRRSCASSLDLSRPPPVMPDAAARRSSARPTAPPWWFRFF